MNGYTTVTKPSKEFRDWDIGPATCVGGVDATGNRLYDWREAADRRLMLARPRYIVQQKARKVDMLGVSDARDYFGLPAVRPCSLRSARND
ncbi:MAG: hypothetical protein K2X41_04370 [Hyphomicrobium sp.]|nr:hypothetical protein [Hyphomicrobium sp.]